MAIRDKFGVLSLALGAFAIFIEGLVLHVKPSRNPSGGIILGWLDRAGFVRSLPSRLPELKPSSIYIVTDDSALIAFQVFGLCLAVVAILLALIAEHHGDDSLFLSGGLISGSLAFLVFNYAIGFLVMAICAVIVAMLRRSANA